MWGGNWLIMLRRSMAILSLVGVIICIVVWPASHYWSIYYRFDSPSKSISVHDGALGFLEYKAYKETSGWHVGWQGRGRLTSDFGWWPGALVVVNPAARGFWLPMWMPTALFSILFWRSFTPLYRRRKRKKLGLCLKCGYDLQGSKERCPECGTGFSN